MSIEKRVQATVKNIEGKIQEVVGEVTGDEKTKVEGQAKQTQASAMHVVEDLKEKAKKFIDKV